MLILLALPLTLAVGDGDLIRDGGFESGGLGWGLRNDWYALNEPKPASACAVDTSVARTGKASLKIVGEGSRGLAIQTGIKASPGVEYRLSCWARGTGLGDARAGPIVEQWDAANNHLGGLSAFVRVPADSWRRITRVFTPKPDCAYIKVMVATDRANDGTVWFDDVSVRPNVPPPPVEATVTVRGGGRVVVDWSAYDAPDTVSYYRIYLDRKPFADVCGRRAEAWVAARERTWEKGGFKAGQRLYVAVTAVDLDDQEDVWVASKEVTGR